MGALTLDWHSDGDVLHKRMHPKQGLMALYVNISFKSSL